MKKISTFIFFVLVFSNLIYSEDEEFVYHKAKKGDGITIVLSKYGLDVDNYNITFIKDNNKDIIAQGNGMIRGKKYKLPIKVFSFDGVSIRSSLGINDLEYARSIQTFNNRAFRKGLKTTSFKVDRIFWVPLSKIKSEVPATKSNNQQASSSIPRNITPRNITEPLFGEKYKHVTVTSNLLADCIFYIVSGHGGPDPGAVGYKDGHELHEDEYAYDVSLRLVRKLLENGAQAHMIVQDLDDGIRDDKYLNNSYNEIHINNQSIPFSQNERLAKRANIINELYNQNKSTFKNQYCIETHVDSRYTGKKVDIFFYHKEGSTEGKKMAKILMNTIKNKYNKAQPGRGYEGSLSSRGLFMIRKVIPTSIFIEIGNIQNPRDQIRIIESNNRQAMANWLCDGIIKSITGKE